MAILDQEWREQHVCDGDEAMEAAHRLIASLERRLDDELPLGRFGAYMANVTALAALAQAHYAAANVRARPASS